MIAHGKGGIVLPLVVLVESVLSSNDTVTIFLESFPGQTGFTINKERVCAGQPPCQATIGPLCWYGSAQHTRKVVRRNVSIKPRYQKLTAGQMVSLGARSGRPR